MEKRELIQELDKMRPIIKELETKNNDLKVVEQRVYALEQQMNAGPNKLLLYGLPLVVGYIAMTISQVILGTIFNYLLGMTLGLVVFGIAFYVTYKKIKDKATTPKVNEQYQMEQTRLANVRKETAQKIDAFIAPYYDWITGIVPEKYCYSFCIDKLRDYLANGRADNMKEAINLYENELHQMRMENQMNNMISQLEEQNRQIFELEAEVRQARYAAESAATAAYYNR